MAWMRSTHQALQSVCVWARPSLQPFGAHWSLGQLLAGGLCSGHLLSSDSGLATAAKNGEDPSRLFWWLQET